MRVALATIFALVLVAPLSAFADTEASAHYMIEQGTLSGGDNTDSSSGSYSSQSSLGEAATGPATSGSYVSQSGFDRGSSSSGSGGSGGSGGGTGGSDNGSDSSAGGGIVIGCADPAASNYSPQALAGNDSGCIYPKSALKPTPTSAQQSTASQTASAAEAVSSSSTRVATPAASLTLIQATISPGSAVSAQLSFANPLPAAAVITFVVVRPDGSVATSSTEYAQPGAVSVSGIIGSLQLPAGSYTLHVNIAYADGTNQDLNQTFTVAQPRAWYQTPVGESAIVIAIIALCWWFFYHRRRHTRGR